MGCEDCEEEVPGLETGNDPTDPTGDCVGVTNCGEPLEVTVVNQIIPPIVQLVCNTETGVYDLVTTPIINGEPGDPTITPTEISCAEGDPPLDIEVKDRCIDGTIHHVTLAFDAAGVETILKDVDTGFECNTAGNVVVPLAVQPCVAVDGKVDPYMTVVVIDGTPTYFNLTGEVDAATVEILDPCDPRCEACPCVEQCDCEEEGCDCDETDFVAIAELVGDLI